MATIFKNRALESFPQNVHQGSANMHYMHFLMAVRNSYTIQKMIGRLIIARFFTQYLFITMISDSDEKIKC
jgi:hypothetical protein